MPLAGWLQLKAPHAEYDSVCSRSAYTALPKRLRDSCCYTEMLGYEPHGMTEIFIKNLRTSLGVGGGRGGGGGGVHLITTTVRLWMDEDKYFFHSMTILVA